jgi:hypothetical protein
LKTRRTTNISLFVTVLSACLLAAGTSAQICAPPAQSVDLYATAFEKNESGKKVRQFAKRLIYQSATLLPRIEYVPQRSATSLDFIENTKSLVSKNNILVVTRLPRAGLENLVAEQSAVI